MKETRSLLLLCAGVEAAHLSSGKGVGVVIRFSGNYRLLNVTGISFLGHVGQMATERAVLTTARTFR
jgi:hypothetical protein